MKQLPLRKCEKLSHYQREVTPVPFCLHLLHTVIKKFNCDKVAILWTCKNSNYHLFGDLVDCWDASRDANKYRGPYPVIAHPPCGPWGKFKWNCKQSRQDGINAINLVHRYGGIVEHPLGSTLFKDHGKGGEITRVNQSDYGHMALKPTLLYFVSLP